MASSDSTALDAALKDYYTDEAVKDVAYEEGGTWFAMIPKLESFAGRKYVQPIQYSRPQGRSASFSKAQANKTASGYEAFEVTMASDFGTHSITRKVMLETRSDRGAFFRAQTREVDSMIATLTRSAAIALYRGGSGRIGVISGTPTTTITLVEPEDIVNFEKGQTLTLAANETTGSERTGTMTVTGVDRDAGTFTVNALIAGASASDSIFVEGDRNAKMTGLLGWLPTSAPSATAFFGVDRTADVTRLAGSRLTITNVPVVEAIRRMGAKLGREGAAPDMALASHQKYRDAELELENKVVYVTTNVTANVGFTGIKIVGARRPITLYADHNCPDANIPVLTKSSWKLVSMGPVPDLVDDDGVTMLREVSASGFEVRAEYYANPCCDDPRANGMLTVE